MTMSWPNGSLALLAVTVMLMNSHSYWVRITSRDHSVASEELSLGWSRRSLAEVRDKRTVKVIFSIFRVSGVISVEKKPAGILIKTVGDFKSWLLKSINCAWWPVICLQRVLENVKLLVSLLYLHIGHSLPQARSVYQVGMIDSTHSVVKVFKYHSSQSHQCVWPTWTWVRSSGCRRENWKCASCRCWPAPGRSGLQHHLYC